MDPERTDACGHDIAWLLHRRADGRLSPQEAAQLESRLASCAACRERAALLDWAVDAVRRGPEVPEGLADAVMGRLASAAAPVRASARTVPLTTRWLAVAAAVLAVGVGITFLRHRAAPTAAPTSAESPRVEVELQLAIEPARSVAVAGDFNGWEAASMKRDENGVWRIRLRLAPGRYQYAFLVDEGRWTADPRAATTIDSGFGGNDSVLEVSL